MACCALSGALAIVAATSCRPGEIEAVAPDAPAVAISEIMYHPLLENAAEDNHEFVEIRNPSAEVVPVAGWRLTFDGKPAFCRRDRPPEVLRSSRAWRTVGRCHKWLRHTERHGRINRGGSRMVDMCVTCAHASGMSIMVQIRNMPDEVHRELKARAAKAGMSLSDFLLQEVTELARRPALDEVLDRIARRPPVNVRPAPAAAVRAERGSRR